MTSRVHVVYMTDRRSLIACQASHSLSTILVECLSDLASLVVRFQAMAIHGKSIRTATEYIDRLEHISGPTRPHLNPRCRAGGPSGGGSLAENVQFYFDVSPFCTIFFHQTTRHFDMDRYL